MPFIDIHGRNLFYVLQTGEGEPQPRILLFAHGLGSSHTFYSTIIPSAVAAGITCLAFDLPGSGLSDIPDPDHGIEGIVRDARHLLTTLKIDTKDVFAIGHSMSGLVVTTLASETDLAGVVLIGPINPSEQLSTAFSGRIKTVKEGGMETMADTIPKAATGSHATSLHHAFIRALLLSQSSTGYISLCNAIAKARTPRYSDIKCPVWAIVGADDQTARLEGVQQILTSCSQAPATSLKSLPGVGHWHCIEAPDAVGEFIQHVIGGAAA